MIYLKRLLWTVYSWEICLVYCSTETQIKYSQEVVHSKTFIVSNSMQRFQVGSFPPSHSKRIKNISIAFCAPFYFISQQLRTIKWERRNRWASVAASKSIGFDWMKPFSNIQLLIMCEHATQLMVNWWALIVKNDNNVSAHESKQLRYSINLQAGRKLSVSARFRRKTLWPKLPLPGPNQRTFHICVNDNQNLIAGCARDRRSGKKKSFRNARHWVAPKPCLGDYSLLRRRPFAELKKTATSRKQIAKRLSKWKCRNWR